MDKTGLLALIDSYITTNGNLEITGAQLNELLKYIVQSYPNKIDDNSLLCTSDYNPARSYVAGMTAVVNKSVMRATQSTTGSYNAAHWEPLVSANTTKTYAELQALVSGAGLTPEQVYYNSTDNIYVTAKSPSAFYAQAVLKASNVDHESVTGNFIGVWTGTTRILYDTLAGGSLTIGNLLVGGTSGAIGEIIMKVAVNMSGQRIAQVISKNGIAFSAAEVITETLPGGSATGVTANTVLITTTSILGTIAINKIVSWNDLHYVNITGSGTIKHPKYDTTNWTVLATTDVSYQTEYAPIIYNFTSNIIVSRQDNIGNLVIDKSGESCKRFQWGRLLTYDNKIFSFGFEGWNAATSQNNLFVQDSGLYIGDTAAFSFSKVVGRSTVVVVGNCDALAADVIHSNFTMTAGLARHVDVHNFGDVTLYDADTDVSDSEFRSCTIILTGTSKLLNCVIDGGYSKIQKVFASESHTDCVYKRGVQSTFETDITIANTDVSIPFDASGLYGVYNVSTTGGVADIVAVGNSGFIVRINPVGTDIQFINNGNLYLIGGIDKLVKANGDWINVVYYNGNNREHSSGLYTSSGGYEVITNKATNFSTVNDTLYPSVKAVNDKINSAIEGLKPKSDVVVATTANITLSGAQTIDGVSVIAGDRVLVKDQSAAADNGIYVVASGSWTRADDASTATEIQGAVVSTQSGTANSDTTWRQTADAITLGVTSLVWSQFGASVPDATPTTKGKARLYSDVSNNNTDGAPDQNSVKTALDLKADLTLLDDLDLHLVTTFRILTNN